MSSRVLRFSPILAHPKLDTLRDIPLAIYWDICLNDDKLVLQHLEKSASFFIISALLNAEALPNNS